MRRYMKRHAVEVLCIDVLLGRIVGRGVTVRMLRYVRRKGLKRRETKIRYTYKHRSMVVTLKLIVLCAYG